MAITLTYPDGGALVTGGTGRVGEAVVRRMAEADVPIVFTYRGSEETARKLEAELREAGRKVTAARLDMTDAASIRAAADLVESAYGPLRTVICGSGVMVEFNKMADFPIQQVERFVNGDALGYYRIFHETIPMLRANGGGSITTCSTMATKRVVDYDGISPFSKGAVDALVRQIAAEEAENSIRCNAVAIGWVEYTSVEESRAQWPKPAGAPTNDLERIGYMMHQITGLARRGKPVTPAEAANTFAYLASDQAVHLTGQCLTLDAGFLL